MANRAGGIGRHFRMIHFQQRHPKIRFVAGLAFIRGRDMEGRFLRGAHAIVTTDAHGGRNLRMLYGDIGGPQLR